MKFEDLLMQRNEEQQHKRLDLENEVVQLQTDLCKEQKQNRALRCALHGPVASRSTLSQFLPLQVRVLLAKVAMVEEEIMYLKRKVEDLKVCLHEERKQNRECDVLQQQQKLHFCQFRNEREESRGFHKPQRPPYHTVDIRRQRWIRDSKASMAPEAENPAMFISLNDHETSTERPNRLSEKLIKCLISIFLKLNHPSAQPDCKGSVKLSLSCLNSKGLVSKTSFNCKEPVFFFNESNSILDPYGRVNDGTVRDIGPYKNFIQFTRNSLDLSHLPDCFSANEKLRFLMQKLCTVDLSFLTYKQKLAFWINIYNACIMQAFLQHGLPSTPDKLLTLMNKAALNVGGIVLNALAIEHFILRYPCNSESNFIEKGSIDEKEKLLQRAYGLGYPEDNVTFALCRGNWSSPPLRVYTAEDAVNELGRTKAEYLEASVGVIYKKKIIVPRLLLWHTRKFAESMESLLEWIYSQLSRPGLLKQSILECLNVEKNSQIMKMVEIQPYESEFRYLLSI
ncbi:hypothetical protein GIB67_024246 [Kingdonia uniflora]|uniref:DUF547 domain-containing protein n=1 Tax=Kingdonia uniflora TaxID=39325 RepID=A0A7J7LZK1_9MAGN|nr:hypothetical protein GIB67_024246 [Kingdonia uniflora]